MLTDFENDIKNCLPVLKNGGLILYPTDTIWGIGCDATNPVAVEKIFRLKQRHDKRSLIILVSHEKEIDNYAQAVDEKILKYLAWSNNPTTVIYPGAKDLAGNLVNGDGTVAIRIVKDAFCNTLIRRFKKPVVSTSANISGSLFPRNYKEIDPEIKNGVDYIVQHRQNDSIKSQPSSIIKINTTGEIEIIR